MKTIRLLSTTLLVLAGTSCGGGGGSDPAAAPNFPAAPTLGAQIDRLGRPAINAMLNATLRDTDAATIVAKKDAYNQASEPATWATTMLTTTPARTVRDEIAINLGILDVLDQGAFPNTMGAGAGCGTSLFYNGGAGTTPTATSYDALAGMLADDMLHVDTTKTACNVYLAVELGVITGAGNTTCGGRMPTTDVIDFSYSALAAGLAGFDIPAGFAPLVVDGVGPHADVSDAVFPFLGTP